MLGLLLVVLLLVVVVLSALVVILVKGNESLKAQHRAYVEAVNSVYSDHSNIIAGLQGEIEDLLTKRADDQETIATKDHHIAGLIKEVAARQATIEQAESIISVAIYERDSLKKDLESACKIADSLYRQ